VQKEGGRCGVVGLAAFPTFWRQETSLYVMYRIGCFFAILFTKCLPNVSLFLQAFRWDQTVNMTYHIYLSHSTTDQYQHGTKVSWANYQQLNLRKLSNWLFSQASYQLENDKSQYNSLLLSHQSLFLSFPLMCFFLCKGTSNFMRRLLKNIIQMVTELWK